MAKKRAKKITKSKKAPRYICESCGLVVSVDKHCGCADVCDIVCCGKQMHPKR